MGALAAVRRLVETFASFDTAQSSSRVAVILFLLAGLGGAALQGQPAIGGRHRLRHRLRHPPSGRLLARRRKRGQGPRLKSSPISGSMPVYGSGVLGLSFWPVNMADEVVTSPT